MRTCCSSCASHIREVAVTECVQEGGGEGEGVCVCYMHEASLYVGMCLGPRAFPESWLVGALQIL